MSESVHLRRNSTSCQESSTDLVEEVTETKRPPDNLRMGIQGSGKRWGRTEMWVLTGLILWDPIEIFGLACHTSFFEGASFLNASRRILGSEQ